MQGDFEPKWWRDNISEHDAEKELRTTRKDTFLVWRRRSPVNMYISYFDHDRLAHHQPIKQLGRFYFLEGIKFRSLSTLVLHHLTMREYSQDPAMITNAKTREKLEATHIALNDLNHVASQPTFCVHRGDLLAEVGRIDDRWLLAKHLPSESIAFFDLTQTSTLSDIDAAPGALPYFHKWSEVEQDEIVQRLTDGGRGAFLIRKSRHTAGAYALLVNTGDKIDKFLVVEVKDLPCISSDSPKTINNNGLQSATSGNITPVTTINGFLLCGRIFTSISQIVHRYSIRDIQRDVRLTHAVLSDMSEHASSIDFFAFTSTSFSSNSAMIMPEIQESDSRIHGKEIVASVGAYYKSSENSDWNASTVALYEHNGSAILRLREMLRGECHALNLYHTELFCLHESLLGREATVFLSPLQSEPGFFLSFQPLHFYTWFHLLRRYTVQRRVDALSSSFNSAINYYIGRSAETEMSILCIHVDKVKGAFLKAETPYRVDISLNGVVVAHTASQIPTNCASVVFDAQFLLIVTSWSCNVQLTISSSGKPRQIAASSLMSVPVSSMTGSSLPLSGGVFTAESSAVHRKLSNSHAFVYTSTRHRVIVLSRDSYTPLMESFLDDVLSLAEWSHGRILAPYRNLLCSVVVSLTWPHSIRALIERTLGKSIRETSCDNLLRQDSFASCLLTAALRMSGKAALEAALIKHPPKFESHTEESVVDILSELARIPSVSLILACVASTVATHLPTADKEHVVRRAISATFVLRFINPLIISTLAASGEGPALARSIQMAANAATMHCFVRDESGKDTATKLYDLFERVRESTVQTVTVEAYDVSPEQMGLLCYLLALTLSSGPTSNRHLPSCSSSSSSSSSSSTVTTSSGSSVGADTDSTTGQTDLANALVTSSYSSSSSIHPQVNPRIMHLLEIHRN